MNIDSCHSFKFLRLDPRLETVFYDHQNLKFMSFSDILKYILSFHTLNKHAGGLAEVWNSPGHRPMLQMVLPSVTESVLLLLFWPFPLPSSLPPSFEMVFIRQERAVYQEIQVMVLSL